jgi:hypothetical protein
MPIKTRHPYPRPAKYKSESRLICNQWGGGLIFSRILTSCKLILLGKGSQPSSGLLTLIGGTMHAIGAQTRLLHNSCLSSRPYRDC